MFQSALSNCCCSLPQCQFTFDLNRQVNGSGTTGSCGINCQYHEVESVKRLNCLMFFEAGYVKIGSVLFGLTFRPSSFTTQPRYLNSEQQNSPFSTFII